MSKNSFDDWDSSTPTNNWNETDSDIDSETARSVKLKIRANPKVIGIACAVGLFIILSAYFLPKLLSQNSDKEIVKVSETASPKTLTPIDLYSQPKLLQLFIDNALASSVTIFCGNYSGSGWAIDLSDDLSTTKDDALTTEIITNNHVIEGCEKIGVTIVPMGTKSEFAASVYSYDRTNDLAILITNKYLPPLPTIQPGNEAHVGQWVMAVGSPGAGDTTLDGSITTGSITNIQEGVIITDTTINPGNSGGPLLNAAGQVIAVVSAKIVDEKIDSIGIARDVALICEQLDGCSKKRLLK